VKLQKTVIETFNLKGEGFCENRSFRHQNNSRGVEYGQRNGKTNFNKKYEYEKSASQNGPIESSTL